MNKFLLVLLLSLSFSVCAQNDYYQKIDSILAEQVMAEFSPGLTIGVVKGGQLIYHNSKGLMNLEYNVAINDSTKFGLASITKQFTSACVAILEKQDKISVNDDVRKYIPELTFFGDTIRVKHLLNHTSGIRNHNVLLDLSGFDYDHQGYTNEMIEQLMFQQKGVNNKPGEKMLYSNTNYVLLALIVKRVSGMEIHQFAKQELFDPLGMKNTFYRSDLNSVITNRVYSYYWSGKEFKQPKSLTLCVGAGGMGSTVSDMAIWSQIFLNKDHPYHFISDFVTQLEPLNNNQPMLHARGMFVTPYKGYQTFNHSGRDYGLRTQFICIPKLDLAVIVFANSEQINAVDVSYKVLDLWLKEPESKDKLVKNHKPKSKEIRAFTGYYQELNSDLRMHLFLNNDTLFAKSSFSRNPVPLASSTKNSFHRLDNESVKYTFITDDNSESDLLVDFSGAIFYFEKIELVESPTPNISEYAGRYFSEELGVTYELVVEKNELILSFPNNKGLVLKEGEKDVFGANRRTKYSFTRDQNGNVISFQVASEGTVKDIVFVKEVE